MGKNCAQPVTKRVYKSVSHCPHNPHLAGLPNIAIDMVGEKPRRFLAFMCTKTTGLSTVIYDQFSLSDSSFSPFSTPPTTTTTIYN